MPMGTAFLPGPGFLPIVLATLPGVGGLVLLGRSTLMILEVGEVRLGHLNIFVAFVTLCVCAFMFERIGYLLASGLFLFVLLWSWSPLGLWRSAIAAAGAAFLSSLFFTDLLGVSLPRLSIGLF